MTKLEVITGSGNTSTTEPLILGESYYVAKYFRSNKQGDSGWQMSISHIYPKFRFPAKDLEDALKKANAYATLESQGNIGYELISLYLVQDVLHLPTNWVADMDLAKRIASEFQPY